MIRKDLESLPAYVPGARMDDALKLSSNESSYAPLPSVAQAMSEAATGVNRYPDMGAVELRTALAQRLGVESAHAADGTRPSALCPQLVQPAPTAEKELGWAGGRLAAYPTSSRVVGATPVAVGLRPAQGLARDGLAAASTE